MKCALHFSAAIGTGSKESYEKSKTRRYCVDGWRTALGWITHFFFWHTTESDFCVECHDTMGSDKRNWHSILMNVSYGGRNAIISPWTYLNGSLWLCCEYGVCLGARVAYCAAYHSPPLINLHTGARECECVCHAARFAILSNVCAATPSLGHTQCAIHLT